MLSVDRNILSNFCPYFPTDDVMDIGKSNMIHTGKLGFSKFPTSKTVSDGFNLFDIKLCQTGFFALCVSAFLYHVTRVIRWGAQEKMIGIYTRRVITFMANNHAFWYRSVCQNVRKSMRAHYSTISTICAITKMIDSPLPYPTCTSLRHMRPKVNTGAKFLTLKAACWTTEFSSSMLRHKSFITTRTNTVGQHPHSNRMGFVSAMTVAILSIEVARQNVKTLIAVKTMAFFSNTKTLGITFTRALSAAINIGVFTVTESRVTAGANFDILWHTDLPKRFVTSTAVTSSAWAFCVQI
jgi:hypothetical protein